MFCFQKARNRGFTLAELLITLIIVGVIAAIAAPNLLGLLNRYRVSAALDKVEGAIKETQRQAMRQGKICRININPTTKILSGNAPNCLLANRVIDDNIDIRTNLSGTPPNINFSGKGNTTKMGTIVLSSDGTDSQKCFVISLGLGISRTGDYTGGKTGSVSANNCQTEN
ncbi:Tfp pilus assembly protein FimT/FimU [Myxosarcina sp. GI1]|uniref:pilus assembly FimT family protein n=1 Tax=Myxosarcina sp. GI1 TaxID=1541065 RepID=UPI0006916564|nr:prepilin-type N-terminal cleavage/methylation domain-containing protein [Myxosarcina sp. GI1]